MSRWSDEELDALSEVSDADIVRALHWWEQHAPRPYKNYLRYILSQDTTPTPPGSGQQQGRRNPAQEGF